MENILRKQVLKSSSFTNHCDESRKFVSLIQVCERGFHHDINLSYEVLVYAYDIRDVYSYSDYSSALEDYLYFVNCYASL